MAAEVSPVEVLHQISNPHTPDLRQRQRDRMSPRRPFARGLQSSNTKKDQVNARHGMTAGAASKVQGNRALEYRKKQQAQLESQGGDDVEKQHNRDGSDTGKFSITPDGGSAGREGRQFTVAKVGNNGKIFLR